MAETLAALPSLRQDERERLLTDGALRQVSDGLARRPDPRIEHGPHDGRAVVFAQDRSRGAPAMRPNCSPPAAISS